MPRKTAARPPITGGPRRAAPGFTLVELTIAVAVVGILSGIAYPSFVDQILKVRRSDALVAVMQVQWAQERWRANHARYGSLAEIGVRPVSTAGHYTLTVDAPGADGYEIVATATGAQSRDDSCRHLKLSLAGAQVTHASGAGPDAANGEAANRKCWML